MAVMGRVVAKFVSDGLMPHNIDSRGVEKFLGAPEDKKVFEAVIVWMLDEGIIRAKDQATFMDDDPISRRSIDRERTRHREATAS
jgi:hypothetical protein